MALRAPDSRKDHLETGGRHNSKAAAALSLAIGMAAMTTSDAAKAAYEVQDPVPFKSDLPGKTYVTGSETDTKYYAINDSSGNFKPYIIENGISQPIINADFSGDDVQDFTPCVDGNAYRITQLGVEKASFQGNTVKGPWEIFSILDGAVGSKAIACEGGNFYVASKDFELNSVPKIAVFDLASGQYLGLTDCDIPGSSGTITGISFTPDGKEIKVAISTDQFAKVRAMYAPFSGGNCTAPLQDENDRPGSSTKINVAGTHTFGIVTTPSGHNIISRDNGVFIAYAKGQGGAGGAGGQAPDAGVGGAGGNTPDAGQGGADAGITTGTGGAGGTTTTTETGGNGGAGGSGGEGLGGAGGMGGNTPDGGPKDDASAPDSGPDAAGKDAETPTCTKLENGTIVDNIKNLKITACPEDGSFEAEVLGPVTITTKDGKVIKIFGITEGQDNTVKFIYPNVFTPGFGIVLEGFLQEEHDNGKNWNDRGLMGGDLGAEGTAWVIGSNPKAFQEAVKLGKITSKEADTVKSALNALNSDYAGKFVAIHQYDGSAKFCLPGDKPGDKQECTQIPDDTNLFIQTAGNQAVGFSTEPSGFSPVDNKPATPNSPEQPGNCGCEVPGAKWESVSSGQDSIYASLAALTILGIAARRKSSMSKAA